MGERRRSEGGRGRLRAAMREFVFGMSGYEFVRHALDSRSALESLFMAVTVGDMVGLPVLPPYYSLRLLPFVVPSVETWKRRVLREREMHEEHEYDLHGM